MYRYCKTSTSILLFIFLQMLWNMLYKYGLQITHDLFSTQTAGIHNQALFCIFCLNKVSICHKCGDLAYLQPDLQAHFLTFSRARLWVDSCLLMLWSFSARGLSLPWHFGWHLVALLAHAHSVRPSHICWTNAIFAWGNCKNSKPDVGQQPGHRAESLAQG